MGFSASTTLGVAVIGSIAASLYTSRLDALLPTGLPARALTAARGSVGGAAVAQRLAQAGLPGPARRLAGAADAVFMHSLSGACLVAAGISAFGVLLVAIWLPSRPRAEQTKRSQPPMPCCTLPSRRQVITLPAGRQLLLAPRQGMAKRPQDSPRHDHGPRD
jgi:hypothetical protein